MRLDLVVSLRPALGVMPVALPRVLSPSRCTASNALSLVFGPGQASAAGRQRPRSGAWRLAMIASVGYACFSCPCAILVAYGTAQKECRRMLGAGSRNMPSPGRYCQHTVK